MKLDLPHAARTRRHVLLVSAVALACGLAIGCDKAKEEPLPDPATVVMPGSPAPENASAAPPSGVTTTVVSSGSNADAAPPATQSATANGSITRGDSGPSTGGTLSVIPGPTATPAAAGTTTPSTAPPAPTSPADPTVLLPPLPASSPAAGRIGPDPAAGSSDDQPLGVAPGTKN